MKKQAAIQYLIDVLGYGVEVFDWDMVDLMEAISSSHSSLKAFQRWYAKTA